jgi:TetR/AcrR family transcriptional regulator
MSEIADHCGVSKANLFHHFTNKRELYTAMLHNACRDAAEHLQHLEARDGGFAERFSDYAADMLRSALNHERLHRLMLRELLTEKDESLTRELAERVLGDKFARLVTILRTGQTRKALRTDFDPAIAAIMLIGMNVFFLQCQKLFKHFPDVRVAADPKRYSALVSDILLRGIMPNG